MRPKLLFETSQDSILGLVYGRQPFHDKMCLINLFRQRTFDLGRYPNTRTATQLNRFTTCKPVDHRIELKRPTKANLPRQYGHELIDYDCADQQFVFLRIFQLLAPDGQSITQFRINLAAGVVATAGRRSTHQDLRPICVDSRGRP